MIYTEIRITHSSKNEKLKFEQDLDEALKKNYYTTRSGWVKEKAREIIQKNSKIKEAT